MNNIKVPFCDLRPQMQPIEAALMASIQKILDDCSFINGPDVKALESEMAEYFGVPHAITVNSGTDALVIALRSMDIGPGDEVITSPFSFFATAESISQIGAKPIFCDIDPNTFNIDTQLIEKQISSKTKAIMPVHIFGRPANMNAVLELARQRDLIVIEDCAQAFGAQFDGHKVGTQSHAGAFSFFPSKNLGSAGDGGMIITKDASLAEMARMLKVHGAKKKYHNEQLGYNSRLDTIQAAAIRHKLPHIESWNAQRIEIARTYHEELKDLSQVSLPEIVEGHVFNSFTIKVPAKSRDSLKSHLDESNVGTMVYYHLPQDQLPVYRGQYPVFPMSQKTCGEVISLPVWPGMPAQMVGIVSQRIREFFNDQ